MHSNIWKQSKSCGMKPFLLQEILGRWNFSFSSFKIWERWLTVNKAFSDSFNWPWGKKKKRKKKICIFLTILCRNVFYPFVLCFCFLNKCFKILKTQWLQITCPGNALQDLLIPLVSKFSHVGRGAPNSLSLPCVLKLVGFASNCKDLYSWKYIKIVFPSVFPPHRKTQNNWNFKLLRPEILFQFICHLAMWKAFERMGMFLLRW